MTRKLAWGARAVVLALAVTFAFTAGAAPSPQELRDQLIPVYHKLMADPQFQALRSQFQNHSSDPATVEHLLAYLPMSPKEMLEIDMYLRHYEIALPKYIAEWHQRWMAMHPDLARQYYGDDVDRSLADLAAPAASGGPAPEGAPVVGTNRNVASTFSPPPTDYQGEIQVVVNPNNASQVVAAANTWDHSPAGCGVDTQAIFYSSDGGATWGHTCAPDNTAFAGLTCTGANIVFGSDPALSWDASGNVFIDYLLICSPDGFNTQTAVVAAKSTNGGSTWSANGIVKNSWGTSNFEDKNFYAVDRNAGSPFAGRHYTCWDRNNNEKFAYSTNGGAAWTEVDLPASGAGGSRFDLACEIAVEDNGDVHVIFDTLTCTASCTNEQMYSTRSTDGGATWSTPVLVHDFNLVGFSGANCPPADAGRCINPFGSIDVDNSGGACDRNLYATFSDWSSGGVSNGDIWVSTSTDHGATWGTPVRVNDDGAGSPLQFHPFLVVDQSNGNPIVAWHDTRNDSVNQRHVDYFAAMSTDCGASFGANVQASQPSSEFNNSGISYTDESTSNSGANPNQYGEYMGLDVLDGTAYIAWTDSRHFYPGSTSDPQKENVGFATVVFGSNAIFSDGFEAGDTSAWSATVP